MKGDAVIIRIRPLAPCVGSLEALEEACKRMPDEDKAAADALEQQGSDDASESSDANGESGDEAPDQPAAASR